MGNDGGSIPGRAELVKEKPKERRAESDLIGRFRAKFCALTKERLRNPIAICRLGYLYNYENLIKLMMEKKMPQQFMHIRKVKDLKKITFQENPDKDGEFPFICPISETVFNGRNKFIVLWSCGCVFSEKVLKDIKQKQNICPICNIPYSNKDMIELGLSNEEIEMKKARLLQEYQQIKQDLQQKKIIRQEQDDLLNNDEQYEKREKKICTQGKKRKNVQQNIMEKFGQTDELYKNSESTNYLQFKIIQFNLQKKQKAYKSLFHTQYALGDNLFNRNVRFGLR